MRTKSFVMFLFSMIVTSILLVLFGQQRTSAIQNIVSTTHQQLRNFHVRFIHIFIITSP